MRIFKQICLFLCWCIIFWGGALKLGYLQPRIKPLPVNSLQFVSFLLIFWQTYKLVDILVARKIKVTVQQLKKRRIIRRLSFLGYSVTFYKIVFVSMLDEKYRVWLSKISLNNLSEENKSYSCYYSGASKIRVIDGYIILYRIAIILAGLILLKYLVPYLHIALNDN
jgi:hypothetical protein